MGFFYSHYLDVVLCQLFAEQKKQSAGSVLQKTCSEKFHESTQLGGMKSTKLDYLTVYFLFVLKKQQSWCSVPVSFLKRYYNGSVFLCFLCIFQSSYYQCIIGLLGAFLSPSLNRKSTPEKFLKSQEMELSSSNIKNFFCISGNGTFQPHIFLVFKKGTLRARKIKKACSEKISCILGNGTFQPQALKTYISERNFLSAKTKTYISLEKFLSISSNMLAFFI